MLYIRLQPVYIQGGIAFHYFNIQVKFSVKKKSFHPKSLQIIVTDELQTIKQFQCTIIDLQ